MLQQSSITAAILLAQELDARGLCLIADAGSPLDVLASTMALPQVTATPAANGEYTPDVNYLKGQSSNWGGQDRGEAIPHSLTLDDMAMAIAKHVRRHLTFARNVVKPVIVEIIEEFQKDIANIQIDPYKDLKITRFEPIRPLIDSSLQAEIEEYASAEVFDDVRSLSLPALSTDKVIDLLLTGHSGADAEIKIWIVTKGEAFFSQLWNDVFTADAGSEDFQSLKAGPNGMDACLAVYLLCNSLHGNPPEGVNMSAGRYDTAVAQMKAQAGHALSMMLQEYLGYVGADLLIKTWSTKHIEVIGEVYDKWLQSGGNQALLLAAVLMDRPIRHANLIIEERDKLERIYQRHVAMLETTASNRRYVHYRELLQSRTERVVLDNMREIYSDLPEDVQVNADLEQYQQFRIRLEEFIPNIRNDEFKNIGDLVLRLVSQCVFYYKNCEMILGGIDAAGEANPDLPVAEAAFLSMIEYVADFVFDQMSVQSL